MATNGRKHLFMIQQRTLQFEENIFGFIYVEQDKFMNSFRLRINCTSTNN